VSSDAAATSTPCTAASPGELSQRPSTICSRHPSRPRSVTQENAPAAASSATPRIAAPAPPRAAPAFVALAYANGAIDGRADKGNLMYQSELMSFTCSASSNSSTWGSASSSSSPPTSIANVSATRCVLSQLTCACRRLVGQYSVCAVAPPPGLGTGRLPSGRCFRWWRF
jgi:hypothetical protein